MHVRIPVIPLRRPTAALVGILALLAALLLATARPAAAAGPVPYPGSVPNWAVASRDAGAAPADETVEGEIFLKLRDPAGAAALASAVSTPGSAQYRKFVSPAQWISQFSPTQQQYDRVVAHLLRGGFTITGTPASRLFVVFRGTAAQLDALFGASLHVYDVDGHRLAAPSAAPTLPGDVADAVSGMELDQARHLTRPDAVPQGQAPSVDTSATQPVTVPTPCSDYYGQHRADLPDAYGQQTFPTYLCGYTPAQLRAAYGIGGGIGSTVLTSTGSSGGLNGAGQTVAIVDAYASPTIVQDVNTYSANRHEPGLGGQYTQIVPSTFYDQEACGFPSGWQTEQTLDVEAVHGIAPAANILYAGGFDCGGGIDVALSQILDQRLATIVSNSYGWVGEAVPDDALRGEENQHLQAVAEGIGLYFSSGDSGDEAANLGTPEPDYPASSPWVTSVGGTSTGIDQNGSVVAEAGWGTHADQVVRNGDQFTYADPLPGEFLGGAGGGRSTIFAEPDYQRGIVPNRLARGNRVSPDVAADADPYTGYLVGLRPIVDDTTLATGPYEEVTFGGTSLSSPLVAAQMALVQQQFRLTLGFANPVIYEAYRADPGLFRDVDTTSPFPLAYTSARSGNTYLITSNRDTSLMVTRGYDDVTGLGAVTFEGLRRAATD